MDKKIYEALASLKHQGDMKVFMEYLEFEVDRVKEDLLDTEDLDVIRKLQAKGRAYKDIIRMIENAEELSNAL